jgi:hypothetical protein
MADWLVNKYIICVMYSELCARKLGCLFSKSSESDTLTSIPFLGKGERAWKVSEEHAKERS